MNTKIIDGPLQGLKIIEVDYFKDKRGFFIEPWNKKVFKEAGLDIDFVQEGHSGSEQGVIRGLHSQDAKCPMGKLVRCTVGEVIDVVVDIRHESATFGKYFPIKLTAKNKKQLYVPPGFAHGFVTVKGYAELQYKQTGHYAPDHEFGILWNDPDINIEWPIKDPIISDKDKKGMTLAQYMADPAF